MFSSPSNTSIGEVAVFLVYLVESYFSEADTIVNNLSTIAVIHGGFPDRSSVLTDNRAIAQLIKGMFSTHPSMHKLHSSVWELVSLLSALSTPFSSQLIALQLSIKVVFSASLWYKQAMQH